MWQDVTRSDIGTYWNYPAQAALLSVLYGFHRPSWISLLQRFPCILIAVVRFTSTSPSGVHSPLKGFVPFLRLCATWILTKELLASSGLRNLKSAWFDMFQHVSKCFQVFRLSLTKRFAASEKKTGTDMHFSSFFRGQHSSVRAAMKRKPRSACKWTKKKCASRTGINRFFQCSLYPHATAKFHFHGSLPTSLFNVF